MSDELLDEVSRAILASVPDGVVGIHHARIYAEAAIGRVSDETMRLIDEIERLRAINTLLSLRLAFWVGRDTVASLIAEATP